MKALFSLSLVLPVALVLSSCNLFSSTRGNAYRLTMNSMFDIDSVRAAMGPEHAVAANKKMSEAVDIYKNKKDPEKSIPLFNSSILLNPTPKAYYELGSALLDNGQTERAILALHMAEQLDYSPLANVMYKLSAAQADRMLKNEGGSDSTVVHYMELALQMGYAHPERFRSDPYFAKIKDRYKYSTAYTRALGGNKDPDKMLWESFLHEFQPIGLPITINTVWLDQHKMEASIAFDYEKFIPEMRNAKFSREVENDFYYTGLVKKESHYTALLYAGQNNFLTDANGKQPVFFFLVTYDPHGKIIDKIQVAGQRHFAEVFKVFTLQPNYSFEIKDYKNIYKEDPEKEGYDSNYVVKSELIGSSNFIISPDGRFVKAPIPLALR